MPIPIPSHAARKQAEVGLGLLIDLETTVARGQPLDQTLAHYYRHHREFGARDRRFFSNLAFAWFRWRGWLPDPARPDARNVVCAWLLDSPEIHPAIEALAGRLPPCSPPRQALGSMPLNEKARRLGQWQQQPPPEPDSLVPAWFANALFCPSGADRTMHRHRCLQAFQTRPPTWLRARIGREADVLAEFHRQDVTAHVSPALSQAICLPAGGNREILNALPEVEIQDLASQCVGRICAPGTGEHWWDACAGSGGKSLHLADLMNNTGSILATDTRANILQEFRRRLVRQRAQTMTLQSWDGTDATAPERLFDGVLVDAPCSGIGTWHRNPDARWRAPADAVPKHAKLQSGLLKTCAVKVRPGGRLVYAVCTLTGAETTGVIESFLAERRDFRLEPTSHPLTGESTGGPIWIWPWEGDCNGMFIARLKKQ